jgi:hypothetical protein
MQYFGPGSEGFVLIPIAGQSCAKHGCLREATHVLIGKDNDLIEFYCFEHGIVMQTSFESKYQFDRENRKGTPNRRRVRRFNKRR